MKKQDENIDQDGVIASEARQSSNDAEILKQVQDDTAGVQDDTAGVQDDTAGVQDDNDGGQSQVDDELQEIKARLTSTEDLLKRAVADYHNLEKRVAESRSQMATWATGELIRKLLPVLDNLEKTVEGAGDEAKGSGWFKGVEMSAKQLLAVLREEGLDQIGADGQFDPSLHEAVDTRDPSAAEAKEGKGDGDVLEVAEKGYNLHGKVLRPARVVVGRKEK